VVLDPERVTKDIGRRIAELRAERRMTQEQFAVRLGVTFQWVSQFESGRNLTVHSLVKIANALNVSVVELFAVPKDPSRVVRRGRPKRAP
jgi:transcriptional regulator with XRE-family HTH domain